MYVQHLARGLPGRECFSESASSLVSIRFIWHVMEGSLASGFCCLYV